MKPCDEDCQLFRWNRCISKRDDDLCDQPERYDNVLNEWGDSDHLREMKKNE